MDTATGDTFFTLKNKTIQLAKLCGYIGFDRLVDICKNLHPHQVLDDLESGYVHLRCQQLDLDRWLDMDDLAGVFLAATSLCIESANLFLTGRLKRSIDLDLFRSKVFHDRSRGKVLTLPDARKGFTNRESTLLRSRPIDQ